MWTRLGPLDWIEDLLGDTSGSPLIILVESRRRGAIIRGGIDWRFGFAIAVYFQRHVASRGSLSLGLEDTQGPVGRRLKTSRHRAIPTWDALSS